MWGGTEESRKAIESMLFMGGRVPPADMPRPPFGWEEGENLDPGFAISESTSRASQNIDEILRENMEATHGELIAREGSIGPTPFMETEEGQDFLLNMVTGSYGGAIGRVSKAAVTGGQAIKETLKRMAQKSHKAPSGWGKGGGAGYKDWSAINAINYHNKINAARLRAQKAFDKHKIPHESEVVDPITNLLDLLKRN